MPSDTLESIRKDIRKQRNQARALSSARYFKTGPGEYGEGDIFWGLTVPICREISKKHRHLPITAVQSLLRSEVHEERSIALMIMSLQYSLAQKKDEPDIQEKLVKLYLKNRKYINNWDLVDGSAPEILGPYFFEKDRGPLFKWARSKNLWERRIAMLTTFHFIRQKDFKDSLKIAEILLGDGHDLIHKAAGWMIREIGNRDLQTELKFLDKHATQMPRTMLRYAIEKFPEPLRQKYLQAGKSPKS